LSITAAGLQLLLLGIIRYGDDHGYQSQSGFFAELNRAIQRRRRARTRRAASNREDTEGTKVLEGCFMGNLFLRCYAFLLRKHWIGKRLTDEIMKSGASLATLSTKSDRVAFWGSVLLMGNPPYL
jgi:hypothetical protein